MHEAAWAFSKWQNPREAELADRMPDAGFPVSLHQYPTQGAGPSLNTGLRATRIEKSGWRGARLTTDHRS
ncbi:hypothetical protein AARI_03050 [Glutamicibacter arilaitensis Re117]|uniref:Uncharacterized protein n=1 Tax=Glutamicibacter arilaitensis (strain DSM 16368 / CIP 108037 / IAM 15318 / JCM 13566 / NCIMB 14258 / Re117) TaxID=861360 RepID=A0ABM9PTL7_GLUAR|nr:hypothetical protein AARI_03050 [Glutamicibacter arilaitensis Re117]